jgi:flagellar biogenesis protein FliO
VLGTDAGVEAWSIARAAYALLAVAAMLVALRFVLARFGGARLRFGSRRMVELVDAIALPHDAAVAVVRVGRTLHVLAVARGAIAPLGTIAADDAAREG